MDITKDSKTLELLLGHLAKRQPESLLIYNLVKHVRSKKWDRTHIFVDDSDMQNCTTVLCHAPSTLAENIDDGAWFLYSQDEDRLKSTLEKVGVAEGRRLDGSNSNTVIFEDFDDKLSQTITEYMNYHGFEVNKTYAARFYVIDEKVSTIGMEKPAPPSGYKLAPLRPEHAGLVASKTVFCSPVSVPLVRKMIEEFPSCGVYAPNRDDPVAWTMMQQHGMNGSGFTLPEYRNRKFMTMRHWEMMSYYVKHGYKMTLATADSNAPTQGYLKKSPPNRIIPVCLIRRTFFNKGEDTKLIEVDPFLEEFKDRMRLPPTMEDGEDGMRSHTDTCLLQYFPSIQEDGLYLMWSHFVNSKTDLRLAMANDVTMVISGDVKLLGEPGQKGTIPIMAKPKVIVSDITLSDWLDKISKYTNKAIHVTFHDSDVIDRAFKVFEGLQFQLHAPVILHADILIGPNGDASQIINGVNFISSAGKYLPQSTVSLGWATRWQRDSLMLAYDWPSVIDMAKYCTRIQQPITFAVRAIFASHSIRQMKWLVSLSSKFTITIWTGEYDIVSMAELSVFRKSLEAKKVLYDVPESFVQGLESTKPNSLTFSGEKLKRNLWQPQPFDTKSYVFLGAEVIAFVGPHSWLTTKVQYQAEMEPDKRVDISGMVQFVSTTEKTEKAKIEIYIRSSGIDSMSPDQIRGVKAEIGSDGELRISSVNLQKAGKYGMEAKAHIPSNECYYFHIVDMGEETAITMNVKLVNCDGGTLEVDHHIQLPLTVPYDSTTDEVFYVTVNGSSSIYAVLVENLVIK
ncbi:menorin-like [Glandiceps talaboti]